MHTVFMLRCETDVFGRKKDWAIRSRTLPGTWRAGGGMPKFVTAGIVVAPRFLSPLLRMTCIYSPNSFMDALRLVQLQ